MKTISNINQVAMRDRKHVSVPDELAERLLVERWVEPCSVCPDLHPVSHVSWQSLMQLIGQPDRGNPDASIAEYLRSRNRNSPRCLYCRANTVTLVPLLGQSTKNKGMCRSCGRSWIENYEVMDVEILGGLTVSQPPPNSPSVDWSVVPSASYTIQWDEATDPGRIIIPLESESNSDEPY